MENVLFVNHSRNLHGAENVMIFLIENVFRYQKENVHIAEPIRKQESAFRNYLSQKGYTKCVDFPYKNWGVSLFQSLIVIIYNIYGLIKMISYIKKENIKTIYSNTSIVCIGIIAARLTGIKHVWHFHEPVEKEHGWLKSLRGLYKILLRYENNLVVFASQTQYNQWKKELPASFINAKVIYDPIKRIVRIDKQRSDDNLIFGYMGSRDKRKNIPFLLDVFAEFSKSYPEVKLVLAKNTGGDAEKIEQRIVELDIGEKITEKQYDNAAEFYSEIDIFILPSLSETWGMVALEAMSVKKAVILTKNTGLQEFLTDDIDCCFINPLDKTNLFAAMKKMHKRTFRIKTANAGYEKILSAEFNKKFITYFENLFEEKTL